MLYNNVLTCAILSFDIQYSFVVCM